MGVQLKNSKFWPAVIAVSAVAAVIAGFLIWHPWTGDTTGSKASPVNSQTARSEAGLVARADFPSSPGVQAHVELTDTTPEMLAAAPTSFKNLGTASFSVADGGQFPETGATITFELPAPPADGHGALIAHWNEQDQSWEPVKTHLSEDRLHATATVTHFSPYGVWDYVFNAVNQIAGNAATSGVQCDAPMPDWVDPQYMDDINGPILWCGGKDAKNADILVAKMKMNRGSAALITTAIKPAWVWSDLWDSMGPETMLEMMSTAGMTSSVKLANGYLVQPLGEYDFGFSKSDLERFYADGRWDKPLVQVSMGWEYMAFGMLYNELKNASDGNVAGAVAMLALGQCSRDLAEAPNADSAAAAFGGIMGCIGSSIEAVEKGAVTFITEKKLVKNIAAKKLVKQVLVKLDFLSRGYTAASGVQKVFTTAGDISLPDISRQFLYRPSLSAIKAAAAKKKALAAGKTYSGSAVDVNYSFSHPADWAVAGSHSDLTISNAAGVQMASLSVLSVWGSEWPGMLADVAAQATHGNFMVQEPKAPCASCTQKVRSIIVDARTATASIPTEQDLVEVFGWPLPVVVNTTVSQQQAPLEKVDPTLLHGVIVVDAGVKGGNGDEKRVLIFNSNKYFSTVAEAKTWMTSPEHAQIEKMMASLRVK